MNALIAIAQHDLDSFIGVAKERGVPDDALVPLLRQNGWSERRVYRALSDYYGRALGMTPPNRSGPAENARDGFSYLVLFFTLGTWATALGQIFYYLIDSRYPDRVYDYYGHSTFFSDMSWQLAAVIVAFPVFVFVQRQIEEQLSARPDSADSGVRKWLTYIALVIAAMLCIGDAIWFLEGLLRGELTIRFGLRVLTLMTIGGGIFAYYLSGIARPHAEAA